MPPEIGRDIRIVETREAVNNFYESITDQGWVVDRDAPIEFKIVFIKDPKTKHLYVLYENRRIRLTSQNNPRKFLKISTLQENTSIAFVRDVLGIKDYKLDVRPKIPPPVEDRAIVVNQTTPRPEQIENIEMQNLGDNLNQVSESIKDFETE